MDWQADKTFNLCHCSIINRKQKKGKALGEGIGNFGAKEDLKKTGRGTASSTNQIEDEFLTKLKELRNKFRFLEPKIGNLK